MRLRKELRNCVSWFDVIKASGCKLNSELILGIPAKELGSWYPTNGTPEWIYHAAWSEAEVHHRKQKYIQFLQIKRSLARYSFHGPKFKPGSEGFFNIPMYYEDIKDDMRGYYLTDALGNTVIMTFYMYIALDA